MSIRILADSTCYLPKEYIEKYNISIASLNVILNNKNYREIDIENTWFYNEMAKSPTIPTSSQPSIEELYSTVESLVKDGHDVVGIFLSSDMSGTFSTSNLVKNMILENYPDAKIVMIDSRSNCMQAGFAVLEAAKAANENKSLDEVVSIAKNVIENSNFIFVPETLEYLKSKGYRIGLASSTRGPTVKRQLGNLGILHYFETLTTGDMVKKSKPDPEIFALAAKSLGLEPAECYAVEDSFNGIKSSFGAGLVPIMVPDKIQPTEEIKKMCYKVFPSQKEFVDFLEGKE